MRTGKRLTTKQTKRRMKSKKHPHQPGTPETKDPRMEARIGKKKCQKARNHHGLSSPGL